MNYKSIFPKSAFLNIKSLDLREKTPSAYQALNYGRIGAVLKNEVKKPTHTEQGLNLDPSQASVEQHKHALDRHLGVFSHSTLIPKVGYSTAYVNPRMPNWYAEGLVFGSIEPRDIDHFVVDREWLSRASLTKLKNFKKPIYAFEVKNRAIVKTKLIFAGSD